MKLALSLKHASTSVMISGSNRCLMHAGQRKTAGFRRKIIGVHAKGKVRLRAIMLHLLLWRTYTEAINHIVSSKVLLVRELPFTLLIQCLPLR